MPNRAPVTRTVSRLPAHSADQPTLFATPAIMPWVALPLRLPAAPAAARLALAHLACAVTAADVADAMGAHVGTARRGLAGLAAEGLAERGGGRWRATDVAPGSLAGRWGGVRTAWAPLLAGRGGLVPWAAAVAACLGTADIGDVSASLLADVAGSHHRTAQRALTDLAAARVIGRWGVRVRLGPPPPGESWRAETPYPRPADAQKSPQQTRKNAAPYRKYIF